MLAGHQDTVGLLNPTWSTAASQAPSPRTASGQRWRRCLWHQHPREEHRRACTGLPQAPGPSISTPLVCLDLENRLRSPVN